MIDDKKPTWWHVVNSFPNSRQGPSELREHGASFAVAFWRWFHISFHCCSTYPNLGNVFRFDKVPSLRKSTGGVIDPWFAVKDFLLGFGDIPSIQWSTSQKDNHLTKLPGRCYANFWQGNDKLSCGGFFLGVSKTRDAHDDMRQPEQCSKPRLVVLYWRSYYSVILGF